MTDAEIRDVRLSLSSSILHFPRQMNVILFKKALGLQLIRTHNWKIMPCSAVTGRNVQEALDWTVNDVADRLYYNA